MTRPKSGYWILAHPFGWQVVSRETAYEHRSNPCPVKARENGDHRGNSRNSGDSDR
jgi:hypothetical protein